MPYSQWAESASGSFAPVGDTRDEIAPGYYDILTADGQVFFQPIRAREDGLLEFPDSTALRVLDEVRDFWNREHLFKKYGLSYKRGILLYGPPGSGKSSCMQIVGREVVAAGGIVVTFDARAFLTAYRAFRDIQPETPMVVLMEDFEEYMTSSLSSYVLNLLDGAEQLHKVLFLASTNYPEKLEPRIINRPSRFDLRIEVGPPGPEARRIYLESLVQADDVVDVDAMVDMTEGLSLAHVKELFVATHILGCDVGETAARLWDMAENRVSSRDSDVPERPASVAAAIAASVKARQECCVLCATVE